MKSYFNISLPASWAELTDKQLLMVYGLFARDLSAAEVKTLCLMKWNGLKVLSHSASPPFPHQEKRRAGSGSKYEADSASHLSPRLLGFIRPNACSYLTNRQVPCFAS